jgi:hypothetical protein
MKKMLLKKLLQKNRFRDSFYEAKNGFSGITFFRCSLLLEKAYIFEIYAT